MGIIKTALYDQPSDILILILTKEKDTYSKATQMKYAEYLLRVQMQPFTQSTDIQTTLTQTVLLTSPKNFKDAMG